MGIQFDEQQRVFHLQGKDVSYILSILKNNQLGHIYFGKKSASIRTSISAAIF